MPLAEVLHEYIQFQAEDYQLEVEEGYSEFPEADGWLPLFGMERYFTATLGTTAGQSNSALVGLTRDGGPYIKCPSLTSLLEFQADLYESGAMKHDGETGDDFVDSLLHSQLKRQ